MRFGLGYAAVRAGVRRGPAGGLAKDRGRSGSKEGQAVRTGAGRRAGLRSSRGTGARKPAGRASGRESAGPTMMR